MRSGTSYFNRTLFLKTVTRFWPLWFIYFAVWCLAMPLPMAANLSYGGSALSMQSNVCGGARSVGIAFTMIAGCVSAAAVWSFLYSSRAVSGMACLPVRREGVFFSVSLGGLLPLLAVHVLIFLLCLAVQAAHGMTDAFILAQWIAAVSLELVFFYGFALLCAQLTGNLAVVPAVYTVLNLTAFVVERVLYSIVSIFVFGSRGVGSSNVLMFLSPPMYMSAYFRMGSDTAYIAEQDYFAATRYYLEGWGVLLAYAAAGLALAGLALWLYRRRQLESAGDVVAVPLLRPVFKYCMTFGGAACIGLLLYSSIRGNSVATVLYGVGMGMGMGRAGSQWAELAAMLLFMFVGAFIGYFASEMLIHKSFKVWRGKRRWLGLGVSVLIVTALMLAAELDLTGYERRVPDAESVASVYINSGGDGCELSEPENIAAAVELHRSIVQRKDWYEANMPDSTGYVTLGGEVTGSSMDLRINYSLKNGSVILRSYPMLYYSLTDRSAQADARAAQKLLNTREAILGRKAVNMPFTPETIISASVSARILNEDIENLDGDARVYVDGEIVEVKGMWDTGEMWVVPPEEQTYGSADTALRQPEDGSTQCDWSFTPEEAAELYNECIVPDLADGTLGTVWLITDEEYENTVYSVRINIDARRPFAEPEAEPGYSRYEYEYFYTVPTVNSLRTNRWLEEHGVILRTVAEAGEL